MSSSLIVKQAKQHEVSRKKAAADTVLLGSCPKDTHTVSFPYTAPHTPSLNENFNRL